MNTKNSYDDISYRLLDELHRESTISQRALADRLGIALGLVNAYLKRLYTKGHIKIKTLPRNRIMYIVTPKGLAEKTRLTYKFMHFSVLYFKQVRRKVEDIYAAMVGMDIRNVLLWGDGEVAELCYISTRGYPLKIVGVAGRNMVENGFFGHHVYAFQDVNSINFDAILVTTLEEKTITPLEQTNIAADKIFYLE